ncbi:MAG TPA: DUF2784 domain-containing protein [Myxococcota bacterium]|nr:DUF2784 domain-containing protein [Myxococcota bacterium]
MDRLIADVVLVVHFAVVVFVVGGLLAVVGGNLRGWAWVNDLRFRVAHLLAIAVVVAQSCLGKLCPLTVLESWLRRRAGQAAYDRSFIAYWLDRIVYYDAPLWVFTAAYTLFGLLVLAAWLYFPPRCGHGREDRGDGGAGGDLST